MDALVLRTDHQDGPTIVAQGILDVSTLEALDRALADLVEQGSDICLDLADLRFCDSAGVQVLVTGYRSALRHGLRFEIRAASQPLSRLLDVTGLRDLLGPFPN